MRLPYALTLIASLALVALAACAQREASSSALTPATRSSTDGPVGGLDMPTPDFLRPDPPPGDIPPAPDSGPLGQVGSSAGSAGVGDQGVGAVDVSAEPLDPAAWLRYNRPDYGLSVLYPPYTPPSSGENAVSAPGPAPLDVVRFIDTRSETPGFGAPLFVIRVFADDAAASLEAWLDAAKVVGPAAGTTAAPFDNGRLTGVKVTRNDMMLPAWSVYLWRKPYVIQLTPLGAEGDTMLANLTLETAP